MCIKDKTLATKSKNTVIHTVAISETWIMQLNRTIQMAPISEQNGH